MFPNTPLSELEQNVTCNASLGLICYNKDQMPPICYNYEIKVKCCEIRPCKSITSTPIITTQSITTITPTTTPTTPKPTTPTTTETKTTTIETYTTPHCKPQCEWTDWIDVNVPGVGGGKGDFETYDNIRAKGIHICKKPDGIQCRAEKYPDTPIGRIGQVVQCNLTTGLICKNEEQEGDFKECLNYQLKVLCCDDYSHCSPTTTSSVPTTTTSTSKPTTTTSTPITTTSTTTHPTTTTETTTTTPTTTETTTTSTTETTTLTTTTTTTPTTTETTTSTTETTTTPTTSTTETTTTPTTSATETTTTPTTTETTTTTTETTTQTTTTTTETTPSTPATTTKADMTTSPHCKPQCKWTNWIDVDEPGKSKGDFETYDNIRAAGKNICKKPDDIECRAEKYPDVPIVHLGQVVQCNVIFGLVCKDEEQESDVKKCLNYQVKVLCCDDYSHCSPTTTPTTTTSTPTTTTTTTPTTTTSTPTTTTTSTPTTTTTETTTPTSTETSTTTETTPLTSTTTKTTTTITTTSATSHTTHCFCHVDDAFFSPGEMIYNMTDHEGCHFFAMCNHLCEAERFQGSCSPTTTPTPKTTTTITIKKTTIEITTAFTGCQPDKKPDESWQINNCTTATCHGHNVITYDSVKCPEVKELTCDNGFPPVKVFSQDGCCFHYECQCVCSGWGDPHYITFDGIYYTFLENCTYVLMQQITPKYDNFRVLVDNYFCDALDGLSCPQSILVYYKNNEVVLTRMMFEGMMTNRIRFNKVWTTPGFTTDGITVTSAGINMIVEIPEIGAYISFSGLIFVVKLPYSKFGYNTEGQCGVCSNNRSDECRMPDGKIVQDCSQMANHWKVNVPEKPFCNLPPPPITPSEQPPVPTTTCPPSSLCDVILSEVFAECHDIIPPKPYHEGCVYDACRVRNDSVECASLEVYASLCTSNGVCINWREKTHGQCPYNCPAGKVYNACGQVHPATCEQKDINKVSDFETEGCYCPKGTVLFNSFSGKCVQENCEVCHGPDGNPVNVGDSWISGCNKCTCQKTPLSAKCVPLPCSEPETETCDKDGFVPEEVLDPSNPCCKKYKCECKPSTCSDHVKSCPLGFEAVSTIMEGDCCPSFECKPMDVCVVDDIIYKAGSAIPKAKDSCDNCECTDEKDTSTSLNKVKCKPVECNEDCGKGHQYTVVEGECCGKCKQEECIMTDKDETIVIKPGETYTPKEDKCISYECKADFELERQKEQCPITDQSECLEGYKYEKKEGACCGKCVRVACVMKMEDNTTKLLQRGETYTSKEDKCISYECKADFELHTFHTEKCLITDQSECPAGYKYEKKVGSCCGICVQVACVMKMDDKTTKPLKPGETYTTEDKCITYECKPDFELETVKEKCLITDQSDCPAGTDYETVKGSCCGICVPVACVMKMEDNTTKLLKPGETYTAKEDKCITYECKPDFELHTFHTEKCLITDQSECSEGYKYEKKVGSCCGICVQVECVMKMEDNTTKLLQPGETYTPEDKCITYECKAGFELETVKEKCPITDQSDCPEGTDYEKAKGSCCGICVRVACVMKMGDKASKLLKPGETYTPEDDKCISYVCKPDFDLETHKEKCSITNKTDCPEGYEYEKVKGACCGKCVQVACVMKMDDKTTKLLMPGETFTPKENKCISHECKPDFELETIKEKCPITDQSECLEGFKYEKKEGVCCGTCVQVACVMKKDDNTTKLIKPGESYTPEDKCFSYNCKADFELETLKEKCPITDQSDCSEGYKYERKVGACCGICVQVACVMKMDNNTTKLLESGETYTPKEDKCISYECKPDFELNTHTEKCPITEQSGCLEGYKYEKKKGACCGTCVQVACVMKMDDNKTKVLKPEETYSPEDDKCKNYTCSPTYDITNITISCPPFDENECKEKQGTVKTSANGCCKHCEAGCLVHKESKLITHGSCESEQTVEMAYCEGSCSTKSIYSADSNSMEHTCSCCQEMKTSQRQIDLKCKNGSKSVFSYTYVEECGCSRTECQDNAQQSKKKL